MARQNINVGTQPNDGNGDPLRTGIIKINDNFTELYTDAPVSNTVTVGNNSVNTFINATAVFIGNSSVNTHITSSSILTRDITLTGDLVVTGNVSFEGETLFSNAINITTTDKMFILANGTANSTAANSSGIAIHTYANLVYISSASGWQSNVNFVPSANNLTLGNNTSVWNLYANTINAVSASLTSTLNTGNTTIVGFANIGTTLAAGNTTITGFVNATVSYAIGSDLIANTTGVYHTGTINAASITVGSSIIANTSALVISNTVALYANGSFGTGGQVLTSNGSTVYWSTVAAGNTSGAVNVDAQYSWTNLHVFSSNVIHSYTVDFTGNANFTNAVSYTGNVTHSNTVTYNGNVTFSNTTIFSGNVTFSNTITANGSVGTNGQVLTTNGTGVYWANASGGSNGTSIALTANSTDTNSYYFPLSNSASGTWSNGVVSNTNLYFVPATGTLSATIFNSLSDREKKENITNITDAIEIIQSLNGVRFDWKNNKQPSAGLIAQDVEKVMPELVYTNPESGEKSLNYSGVIAVLVEAIKHLINKG